MQFSVNASVSLQTLDLRTRFNLQVSFRFLEKHIHLVKLGCPLCYQKYYHGYFYGRKLSPLPVPK